MTKPNAHSFSQERHLLKRPLQHCCFLMLRDQAKFLGYVFGLANARLSLPHQLDLRNTRSFPRIGISYLEWQARLEGYWIPVKKTVNNLIILINVNSQSVRSSLKDDESAGSFLKDETTG